MAYLTKEQLMEAVKNAPPLTLEEKKKAKDLQNKIRSLSDEELKKFLMEPEEE